MKICFLGTACAEPTEDNGYTSFLLEAGRTLVLIDASGNPVQSMLRAGRNPMDLDVLVLTHYHADHIGGYPSLMQTLSCLGRKRHVEVVCSSITEERTLAVGAALDIQSETLGFDVSFHRCHDEEDLKLTLAAGIHSVPSNMVSIEADRARIFYTSDTEYNPEVAAAARGSRLLIHEATFSHRYLGSPGTRGHSSAYQAGMSAASAGVETLFLCHYCARRHSGLDAIIEEARRAFDGEVVLPSSFLWYEF